MLRGLSLKSQKSRSCSQTDQLRRAKLAFSRRADDGWRLEDGGAEYDLTNLDGAVVTFTNTSTPSSGQAITGAVWDLDDDGEFDESPTGWSFGTPGNHAVSVRVTQSNGKQAVKQRNIRVNAPPTAAFVWSPSTLITNESVDLISTSTDAEGPLAAQD